MLKGKQRFGRIAVAAALGLSILATGAAPVEAQHRRSCHFVVEVVPTDGASEQLIYSFRVYGTVQYRSQANDLRRDIRRDVTTCLQSHWANRDAGSAPAACDTRFEMQEYPFTSLAEQIRDDLCNANRDALRVTADVELFIRGERGCIERDEERGVVDPAAYIVLAPGYQLVCPIRDAGGSEAYFPFTRLPGVRLPGHDLAQVPMTRSQGPDDCEAECADYGTACQAWTYRGPGTSGARYPDGVCLLKSAGRNETNDPCCESGIRN